MREQQTSATASSSPGFYGSISVTSAPLPWQSGQLTEYMAPALILAAAFAAVPSPSAPRAFDSKRPGATFNTTLRPVMAAPVDDLGWSLVPTAKIPVALAGAQDMDWSLAEDERAF